MQRTFQNLPLQLTPKPQVTWMSKTIYILVIRHIVMLLFNVTGIEYQIYCITWSDCLVLGASDCQCSCQHPLKASSTPTASSTSPSHTQSGANINKNESSRASEPTVSDEAQNLTPNQIFATPPAPEPFTGLHTKSEHFTEQHSLPVHEESANFIISPTPNLIYNSSHSSIAEESEQQSITTSSELPSIPTRTVLQSETSQPSEKNNTTLISDRNPVLVLAKRSLGSREQETPSVTYSKLLWSWIAETKGIRKNTKVKLLEISSEETEHVEHNSPTQPQMHHHIDKPLPGFKNTSKNPACKGDVYFN